MPTPTSTSPFDTFQQIFSLSLLANKVWLNTGSQSALQQQLQYDLSAYLTCPPPPLAGNSQYPALNPTAAIQGQIGNWQVVWGPVVWQDTDNNSDVADNAMYVAYAPQVTFPALTVGGKPVPAATTAAYVIAIAATNPCSSYDWLTEDFDVSQCVAYNGWNPQTFPPTATSTPVKAGVPVISMGTAIGISRLLALASPTGAVAAGTTLQQFLTGLGQNGSLKGATVVTAGHSLAGALSPTLALYLSQQGYFTGATQYVFPTAGATPGNAAFANIFANQFPAATAATTPLPYQQWNQVLWNQYDIVPHAWNVLTLAAIPGLYGTLPTDVAVTVDAMATAATTQSTSSLVDYVHLQNVELQGTLQPPAITSLETFVEQAGVQHMGMYSGDNVTPKGLILQDGMQAPPSAPALLPGVAAVSKQSVINAIVAWLLKKFTSALAAAK